MGVGKVLTFDPSPDYLSVTVSLSTSPFELFGLPQSFDVDLELLDTRYRGLQQAAHPDRFANASDQERRISMQHATQINEGYRTLKDPLLRGRYLLELDGHRFDDEHHTTRDAVFLMEQMELREALANVRGADDAFGVLGDIMERITADLATYELQLADQRIGGAKVDTGSEPVCVRTRGLAGFRYL